MKVLVVGVGGMLGNGLARVLPAEGVEVYGLARGPFSAESFPRLSPDHYVRIADVQDLDALRALLARLRPDAVINAVGVVKQLADADDPLVALPINALLPHQLARLCGETGARLVHVSTDCVFDGARGHYTEADRPDATDLYGRSKLLGEVDYPHAITLRTSLVGHELGSCHSLIDWFLAQAGPVYGFTRAVFSGVTTVDSRGYWRVMFCRIRSCAGFITSRRRRSARTRCCASSPRSMARASRSCRRMSR